MQTLSTARRLSAAVQIGKEESPYRVRPHGQCPINDPKHWRDRAEEARTVADEMSDPDAKRKMLRIAEDYEELARRAERRLLAAGKISK
jgi:hypothetical protein